MKFIKKHIGAIVAIMVFILVVIGLLIVKNIFFSNDSKAIYGNRLEGIENVPVTNDTKNQIKEVLKEGTTSVAVRVAGRIIYVDIEAAEGTTLDAAKEFGNKTLEYLSEEQRAYYDIQIMINCETNTSQFPIIGYKHHAKTAISWTKDRTES